MPPRDRRPPPRDATEATQRITVALEKIAEELQQLRQARAAAGELNVPQVIADLLRGRRPAR